MFTKIQFIFSFLVMYFNQKVASKVLERCKFPNGDGLRWFASLIKLEQTGLDRQPNPKYLGVKADSTKIS